MHAGLREIPTSGMSMKDAVNFMSELSNKGYCANLKSRNGMTVIQVIRQNS